MQTIDTGHADTIPAVAGACAYFAVVPQGAHAQQLGLMVLEQARWRPIPPAEMQIIGQSWRDFGPYQGDTLPGCPGAIGNYAIVNQRGARVLAILDNDKWRRMQQQEMDAIASAGTPPTPHYPHYYPQR